MGENNYALGLLPLDDLTTEILTDIISMTPEERETLLELLKEAKNKNG